MRGTKFLIVFVFGLLGLNESSAQIFVTELFPTHKDSLYDYQIYQRYYWWAYYPGLCGYTWGFRHLDGQLTGQLSALGYLPQLNYFNCPIDYSYYTVRSYNSPYWQKNGTRYFYRTRNSGKNSGLITEDALISMNENSIDRVVSKAYKVKISREEMQSDIDQFTVIEDKSEKTVHKIEIKSTQRIVLVKQPAHVKEISMDKIRGKDQLKTNLKEKGSWNTESISEKIKKDFQLSSGTRKVYVVDKPKRTNGWENFRGIYNRSSQNNKNKDTEKTYSNNNTQHSYSSGSGNNTQRKNSPQNSSRVSKVSVSKTRD